MLSSEDEGPPSWRRPEAPRPPPPRRGGGGERAHSEAPQYHQDRDNGKRDGSAQDSHHRSAFAAAVAAAAKRARRRGRLFFVRQGEDHQQGQGRAPAAHPNVAGHFQFWFWFWFWFCNRFMQHNTFESTSTHASHIILMTGSLNCRLDSLLRL